MALERARLLACEREQRCPLAGMVAEIGTRRGAVQRQARGESHTRGTRAARCERHACWLCPNQRKVVRVLCACVVPALVRFSQTRFLRLRLADYPYPANDIFLLAEAERFSLCGLSDSREGDGQSYRHEKSEYTHT